MSRRTWPAAYAIAAVTFLALDAAWLGVMTPRLYRPALAHLMTSDFAVAPALLFYVAYIAGIVGFAVLPGVRSGSARAASVRGAALGGLAYATYDLTNQATLRGWPWSVTVADLAWGTTATGLAAGVTVLVLLRWARPR